MWIKEVSISNYARFQKLEGVKFARHRTAIVGQNNVGKSALLRAISSNFSANTHKTLSFRRENPHVHNSIVKILFSSDPQALLSWMIRASGPNGVVYLPLRDWQGKSQKGIETIISNFYKDQYVDFHVSRSAAVDQSETYRLEVLSSRNLEFNAKSEYPHGFPSFSFDNDGQMLFRGVIGVSQTPFSNVAANCLGSVFWFKAERLNVAASGAQRGAQLVADCANLAAVLDNIQPAPVFAKLQELTSEVLPTVKKIGVGPGKSGASEREILIWQDVGGEMREGISLADCGSGVGQVLAILTATLVFDSPRVVLIDEPNSFLHPSATRALMSILAEFKQHQFIIATHSMEALRAFDPEEVILLEAKGAETKATGLGASNFKTARRILSELGVSVSDVTGADYCLWVEGHTESDVFPLLTAKLLPNVAGRIAFPRVGTTGAFDDKGKRSKEELLDIYRNLTDAVAVMPNLLAFVFDREGRTPEECADLSRQMGGKVGFLKRRCFENYLLDPAAVAEVLNQKPYFAAAKLDAAKVQNWWDKHAAGKEFWPKGTTPKATADKDWHVDIDAAKLLAKMTTALSEGKAEYRKTEDSVAIAKVLLDTNREAFREIADIIERFLKQANPR